MSAEYFYFMLNNILCVVQLNIILCIKQCFLYPSPCGDELRIPPSYYIGFVADSKSKCIEFPVWVNAKAKTYTTPRL